MNEKWVVVKPYGWDKDEYFVYGIFESENDAYDFIREQYDSACRAVRIKLANPQEWA